MLSQWLVVARLTFELFQVMKKNLLADVPRRSSDLFPGKQKVKNLLYTKMIQKSHPPPSISALSSLRAGGASKDGKGPFTARIPPKDATFSWTQILVWVKHCMYPRLNSHSQGGNPNLSWKYHQNGGFQFTGV